MSGGGGAFVNCLTESQPTPRLHKAAPKHRGRGTTSGSAVFVMTQEADVATSDADTHAPRRSTDLLGLAYLATTGIVMTAWIGGLIWVGFEVVRWLLS